MIQKFNLIVLLVALMYAPMDILAQNSKKALGVIYKVDNSAIIINDTRFKVLSTVNIYLENKQRGSLSDLQQGETVLLNIVTIDKRQYVDTISIVSESDQE